MSKVYTHEDALSATLEYFEGDDLATNVWLSKYALRDAQGELLEKTPSDMHRRLAREFARIEQCYPNPLSESDIYELLSDWTVVPQGSPMSGIGNTYQLQALSNCFVIESARDSFGSILKTDEEQCQIMKRRGGVGHDISNIRPRGVRTNNAAKTTDGIGAFMERFSNSCRTTAQGGRRGALMLTIACNHYEIDTFIDIKRDRTKVTGANISIRLSDAFMEAVENDGDFTLQWPVDVPVEEAKVSRVVKARDLWNKITSAAHDNAEPGLLFWDTITKNGISDCYPTHKSSSTNPCSEIAMDPHSVCRLMLLNLTKFIAHPFTSQARFLSREFGEATEKAQRLMDDLVDLDIEFMQKIIDKIKIDPEPENVKRNELELWENILKNSKNSRRVGLGVTGVGDALAMLDIKYGAGDSVKQIEEFYKQLSVSAYKSTIQLASERGSFQEFDANIEKDNELLKNILATSKQLKSDYKKHGRRNIALLTTAPAGSVSLLTRTTSGIEPVFRASYTRRKKISPNDKDARVDFTDATGDRWQHFEVLHPGVSKWMSVTGLRDTKQSPYHLATSEDVDWKNRIEMQASAQKWLCHSISSTINLPKGTTLDTVKEIYMHGWKSKCKGLTIYVDGSRDGVLVENNEEKKKDDVFGEVHATKRPKELDCDIHRVSVKGETFLVFVGLFDGKPYEVFVGSTEKIEIPKKCTKAVITKNGKKDGVATYNLNIPFGDEQLVFKNIVNLFDNALHGAMTRMISLSLRHGIPPKFISEQLKKDKHSDMMSFSSVIARVLAKTYVPDGSSVTSEKSCTDCGSTQLVYQQGCVTCADCGSSKCG